MRAPCGVRLGVQDLVEEMELASRCPYVGACVYEVAGRVLGLKETFELATDCRLGSRQRICGAVDDPSFCDSVHAVDFQEEAGAARHVVDESGEPRLGGVFTVQ